MIGIIGALEEEVNEILALMDHAKEESIKEVRFFKGQLSGKDVVVMQSGVGKVLSAMTTTMLLERYDITGIVNVGTAGGLSNACKVLDIIVATKVAQFDIDLTEFGYEHSFSETRFVVDADIEYVKIAEKVLSGLTQESRVFIQPMVTSDQFIHNQEQIDTIMKNYPEAYCADMEAGAIGMVCRQYKTPFIVIRSLSDVATRPNNELTFEEYVKEASKRSAEFCRLFVREIL